MTGEAYIDPENTPGPLAKAWDALLRVGLSHGWLNTKEDQK